MVVDGFMLYNVEKYGEEIGCKVVHTADLRHSETWKDDEVGLWAGGETRGILEDGGLP